MRGTMRSPISTTESCTPRAASASMMMQPMKPAPICSTRAPGLAERHDLARVGKRPAGVHAAAGRCPGSAAGSASRRWRSAGGRTASTVPSSSRTLRAARIDRTWPARCAARCAAARSGPCPCAGRSLPRRCCPSADRESPCANRAAPARRRRATMSSSGACLRIVSAAMTPAGPLPRMTCFMGSPPAKRAVHKEPPVSERARCGAPAPPHSPRRVRVSGFSCPLSSQPRSW